MESITKLLGPIKQIGIVVEDIDKGIEAYQKVFGAELKGTLFSGGEGKNVKYLGKATDAGAKLAFFDIGGLEIELLQPVGKPSTWETFLSSNGDGLHHIAFHVADANAVARQLVEKGLRIVQTDEFPNNSGQYIYLDATELLGMQIELLQYNS